MSEISYFTRYNAMNVQYTKFLSASLITTQLIFACAHWG